MTRPSHPSDREPGRDTAGDTTAADAPAADAAWGRDAGATTGPAHEAAEVGTPDSRASLLGRGALLDAAPPGRLRAIDGAIILAIFLITLVLAVPGITSYRGVSPIDEITHFDYAYTLAVEHRIPASVEPLSEEALSEWACRPSGWTSEELCDLAGVGAAEGEEFPAAGLNYNGFHPPLYYFVTGWFGRAVAALTSLSLFEAMRLGSAVWLAAGLSACYLVISRHSSRALGVAAAALIGATPTLSAFAFIVNPDSTAALAGAAALFIALASNPPILAAGLLAFLIASTKLLAAIGILCVAGIHFLTAWWRDSNRGRWALVLPSALLGTAVSAIGSRLLTRSAGPSLPNPILGVSTRPSEGAFLRPVIDMIGQNAALARPYWFPDELDSPLTQLATNLFVPLVLAAPILALATRRWPMMVAGLALLAGMLFTPVVIQIREILSHGLYFPVIVSRYSIVFLPFALGLALLSLRDRPKTVPVALTAGGIGILFIALQVTGIAHQLL